MKTQQLILSIIILTIATVWLNALNAQEREGRSRPMTFTNPDMHDPVMAVGNGLGSGVSRSHLGPRYNLP